jgi:menaquinone-9 beta-reductase
MATRSDYDVIIAGGGPAGASAAILLATRGARVLLAEQKKFPRAKLCGEFISPECTPLFDRLGVADHMFAAHPAELTETVFYSRSGRRVQVPSSWFGSSGVALGLSRAEMDERLLRRAAAAGADVLEEAHAGELIFENDAVCGVKLKTSGEHRAYRASVMVDATGRSRTLARHAKPDASTRQSRRAPMVAFKVHLENTAVAPGACEIYFYRGGYGGLSSIEGSLSNLCFIANARDVRNCGADADRVMREIVSQNRRARATLENARAQAPWLAVSLEGFGRYSVAPAPGLLTIGDAASFIDPFTGSGMLMALQSGELAAGAISDFLDPNRAPKTLIELQANYSAAYQQAFDSRLKVCSFMRKVAFMPGLAEIAISLFSLSEHARRRLARATRGAAAKTNAPVQPRTSMQFAQRREN